jgi:DNA helicase-2/ATP-dependent DNA helicase PcrA
VPIDPDRLLERLNPPQREAVTHGEGPLLILAGAGSGKTRVITHRIAWLAGVAGADPRQIVAMTFTNKAAKEMRERAEGLLRHDLAGAYVGTFHAFGLRLLRMHALDAGYPPTFVVYDSADQLAAVRAALKELSLDDKSMTPRQVLSWISRQKNALVEPDAALARAMMPQDTTLARVYGLYAERLKRAGAMDFDDLLVQLIRLFRTRPDVADRHAQRIRWLLVDEYQDTNPIQYALIRLLAARHRNVCCVGDEDQSIYAFRGADIRNILDFERDFKDATIVKLEQNYRSTRNILAAATAVIRNNANRHDKTLWTENAEGAKLQLHTAQDDRAEADFVVEAMLKLVREHAIPLDQVGVLYRTNATSRLFEDRLMARNIPYRVVGSLRFYERKEIKDVLAWLRLLVHPDSDEDFLRAAQTPPRGLGETTLGEIARRAREANVSLFAAARDALSAPGGLNGRAVNALTAFLGTIRDLTDLTRDISTAATVTSTIEAIDYALYLEKAHPEDHVSRAENLDALTSAAEEHDEAGAPEGMAGFLDRVSLRSDSDDVAGERGPSLMTVHSAKGLEFDAVFLAGLNEELFPHSFSAGEPDGLEEERRLMYVALTRARKVLTLTSARFRHVFGQLTFALPSRFLDEIPEELLRRTGDGAGGALAGAGFRPRFGDDDAMAGFRGYGHAPAEPRARPAGIPARRGGPRRVEREPAAAPAGRAAGGFRPGMRIVHPQFGAGTVLSASGQGKSLALDIRFERAGRKKILAAYTTLVEE